ISKVDNASKALDRVSKAVDIVSQLRSKFGSTQNRLEHAIASNENKSENTQASESRIRDADMSERMMELAKYNILQQAGEAMMAQSNKSNQGILSLLQ
ncbi:MAG: flagellin, partial [Lachnospiraceae bacterium]|nr:flagellin [Lachnospiraceae bacterium]